MSVATTALAPAADTNVAPPERRGHPVGWWGMVALIATEATIFASLLGAYFFLRAGSVAWPQGGIEPPELKRIGIFTAILLGSSIPLFIGSRAIRRGNVRLQGYMLALSFAMGLAFITHQAIEYHDLHFGIRDNAYASAFYVITGLHGLHVIVGLLMSLVVQAKVWTGRVTKEHHLTVEVFDLYWHFVDAVWIFVFSSLYLSAHIR